jgi:hypothetical protein
MGQREVRLVQCDIVIGEKVDVHRPRPPAAFLGTRAPQRTFHRLGAAQKHARREIRLDGNAHVDERRLVLHPPRLGAIVRRARKQAHVFSVAERGDGAIERVTHVSDIAPERDERFSHGLGGRARW